MLVYVFCVSLYIFCVELFFCFFGFACLFVCLFSKCVFVRFPFSIVIVVNFFFLIVVIAVGDSQVYLSPSLSAMTVTAQRYKYWGVNVAKS